MVGGALQIVGIDRLTVADALGEIDQISEGVHVDALIGLPR
jgi:hypothetical protein